MKKLLIATVLTAAFGIGGVTFASTNDVQNNNEPIKMNLLVERNHDDANNFQDKKCDMPSECQNNQMHGQHRMGHMPMNHQDANMHRKDNDQSMRSNNHKMRPEGENHQMRPEGQNHQMRPEGHNHQMPPQGQPPQGNQPNGNAAPQPPMEQGAPQTTQDQ